MGRITPTVPRVLGATIRVALDPLCGLTGRSLSGNGVDHIALVGAALIGFGLMFLARTRVTPASPREEEE
jgi:hypothetical protein